MNNPVEILNQGFACLVEKMQLREFAANAAAYAKSYPYTGKGQIL